MNYSPSEHSQKQVRVDDTPPVFLFLKWWMKTSNSVTLDNCTVVFLLSKYNLEVIRAVAGNDKCADCGSPGKSKNIKDHLLFLNCTVNVEKC